MAERVWNRFLTPEDKESLKERPAQVWGYGQRPALVLVDLFNLFDMHEKYADVLGVDEIVAHLEDLAGKTPAQRPAHPATISRRRLSDVGNKPSLPAHAARNFSSGAGLLFGASIVGFALSIWVLGLPVAAPAFIFLMLWLRGHIAPWRAAVFGIAVWAFVYIVAYQWIHLPLPSSLISEWRG